MQPVVRMWTKMWHRKMKHQKQLMIIKSVVINVSNLDNSKKPFCVTTLPSNWIPMKQRITAIDRTHISIWSNCIMRTKMPKRPFNWNRTGQRYCKDNIVTFCILISIICSKKGYFRKAEVQAAAGQYDTSLLLYGRALQLQPNDISILNAAKRIAQLSNADSQCKIHFLSVEKQRMVRLLCRLIQIGSPQRRLLYRQEYGSY